LIFTIADSVVCDRVNFRIHRNASRKRFDSDGMRTSDDRASVLRDVATNLFRELGDEPEPRRLRTRSGRLSNV
jgi:hypothetical protein